MLGKIRRESGAIFIMVIILIMLISVTAILVSTLSRAQKDRYFYIQNHLSLYHVLPLARNYAKKLIKKDEASALWKLLDVNGAIAAVPMVNQDIFRWQMDDYIVEYGVEGEGGFQAGFLDEDSKLNLNALDQNNKKILEEMLLYLDVPAKQADEIVLSVIDWTDNDLLSSHEQERLESEYYEQQDPPILPLNKPLESIQDLSMIRGVDETIFELLRQYCTLYPKSTDGVKVNFLTVSEPVLYALLMSAPAISEDDAEFIARDFVRLRTLFFSDWAQEQMVTIDDIIGIGNWSARHQLLLQSAFQQYGKLASDIIHIPIAIKANENSVPLRAFYLYDRANEKIIEQGVF